MTLHLQGAYRSRTAEANDESVVKFTEIMYQAAWYKPY
jgi:hypothetical protein